MNAPSAQRLIGVTLVGWIWIIIGTVTGMSGSFGLTMYLAIIYATELPEFPTDVPPELAVLFWIFKNFQIITIVQIIFAILAFFGGINYLKLRRWARLTLESLSILVIAVVVGLTGVAIWMWSGAHTHHELLEQSPDFRFFQIFVILVNAATALVIAAILVATLFVMRSPKVRAAFANAEPSSGVSVRLPETEMYNDG